MKRVLAVLLLSTALAGCAPASRLSAPAPDGRVVTALSSGWRFHLGDAPGAVDPGFDDSAWQSVSVPHNWNRMGGSVERSPTYHNVYGPGWYRLSFDAPAGADDGNPVWLEFDGASINADVWLNGVHLGQHKGAFARFRLDASKAVKRGGRNVLTVRADNSKSNAPNSPTREVIPISGDWPMFGGLYRDVSLLVTAPVHIELGDFGGPGVYANVLSADAQSAVVKVRTLLRHAGEKGEAAITVTTRVLDADGKEVARDEQKTSLTAGQGASQEQSLTVPAPRLWDGVKDPYLYKLEVSLKGADGKLLDSVTQPLGIRTFRIDPNQGFFLNGRHVSLQGVSRHQDRPDTGWALTQAQRQQDVALIQEIGANTVRLAHYQHDQATYSLMDQAGMVVWAEVPLVDRTSPPDLQDTTPALADNAEQQLKELIRQNYNHPSIVTWSIGNEVNLIAAKGLTVSNAKPLLDRLNKVARAEDASRPSTLADCCGSVPAEARPGLDTVAGITDVIGYNRYYGWYSPDVGVLRRDLERLHAMYPNQAISIAEYGAGGALSQHTDNPKGGPIHAFGRPHPEDFQSYILEESWKQIKPLPFIWASWVWNMFDFSNDARLEGDLIDTNDKGLVTFDRQVKKDAFYFYKANWNPEPMVYLTGRRHDQRPYPVMSVKAYSNASSARLSVGGKDLGEVKCDTGICFWPAVPLVPGANEALVTATVGDKPVTDKVTWNFAGEVGTYRIRAGNLVGAVDGAGARWGSDDFFTGGAGKDRDPPAPGRGRLPQPPKPLAGTTDQTAYEAYREGTFTYSLSVPDGAYRVTVHSFEPNADAKPGARTFDVLAEGKVGLKALDPVKTAGSPWAAVKRDFTVTVRDGKLDLAFQPRTGNALVSGIEVVPAK
ncbi:glycoside hydrolase family 2 TIM barrel-domain containing protein [Niveispirillum sp. KHB5.9]|uniref:glycoside hydrolase family 2 TIM barrel-domain containing protein n=1 Tax=Niveispirillum sp. KHB5.9 TaxID=3400269 RepID=UPI003A87AF3C